MNKSKDQKEVYNTTSSATNEIENNLSQNILSTLSENGKVSWQDYFAKFWCNKNTIAEKLKDFKVFSTENEESIDSENLKNTLIEHLKSIILKPWKKALVFCAFKKVISNDSDLTSATFSMILPYLSIASLKRIIKEYELLNQKNNTGVVKSQKKSKELEKLNNELRNSRKESMFQFENNINDQTNLPWLNHYDTKRYDHKKAVPGYMKINNSYIEE